MPPALSGRLPPPQHRVEQIHRHQVGEPRRGHLGQFLGRTPHVQRRADPHPRLVQQIQPPPRDLGTPRDRRQFRGVPQSHHAASPVGLRERRPLVHRQQPVPRAVHLVGDRLRRRQQAHDRLRQPQLPHRTPVHVLRQPEQPRRLVVRQQQSSVGSGDQHALPHRVQDRVVVLVQPRQIHRGQAVRVPPEPPGHQRRSRRGQRQRGRATAAG